MKILSASLPKWLFLLVVVKFSPVSAQEELKKSNIVWNSQSKNSGESMPCGGGDIGLNVWVEDNDLLFYLAKSGTFDENNALLKLGRIRIRLSPNPFSPNNFKQELILKDGYVNINADNGKINTNISIWVDVFHAAIHVDIKNKTPLTTEVIYES